MPLEEYLTEADIKSLIPELSRFMWIDEIDYSPQKKQAISDVMLELSSKGYRLAQINPRLMIRNYGVLEDTDHTTDPTSEDTAARLRYVLRIKEIEFGHPLTIYLDGSNDRSEWINIDTTIPEAGGLITMLLGSSYLYYRIRIETNGGRIDYEAYLCDTGIEKLIAYKWLELILLDRFTSEDDQYYLKMKYFKSEYERMLGRMKIWIDKDSDGITGEHEFSTSSSIRILK